MEHTTMKPRKVVVTDYIEPDLNWERQEMAQRGVEFLAHQLKFAPHSEVIAATRDADVVVVNMVPITPEIISGWEKCRLVIRHGVGYDNVDVPALEQAGIPLCYIPDYCAEEVAEQAIALLLACGRRLAASRRALDISPRGAPGISKRRCLCSSWRARPWALSAAAASALSSIAS